MRVESREDNTYWIVGVPDTVTECGPYETKAEAMDDMRGLKRSILHENDPEFCLGIDEARIWRQKMHKQLERMAEVTYRELSEKQGDARIAGTDLIRTLCCLQRTLTHIAKGKTEEAVQIAKEACEELADRTGQAYRNGDDSFGNYLQDKLSDFAPVVARLLSVTKPPSVEE